MEVGFTHPWGWPGGAIAGAQTGPNMFGTDRLVCANPATAGVVGGYLPVLRWTYEETAAGCTALSGPIFTILTVLSWICVGIHMCGALPSPVLA